MKQLVQSLRTGKSEVQTVPAPSLAPGAVLVQAAASLVSAGTERALVEFSRKNLWGKAKARPDLMREAWRKTRQEGFLSTWEAAWNRLDRPFALGYCSAGTVLAVGEAVSRFQVGDAVACGGGSSVHAEILAVPANLVVQVPATGKDGEAVPIEGAAFATLGAIALHGIRLADVKLGEVVAVLGLGLVGQLTVQLLKASGCQVVGLDLLPDRAALAHRLGADAVATSAEEFAGLVNHASRGAGADAVLITADTASNEPVELAGRVARLRAEVISVGAVGLSIPRKLYYEKELSFRVSRSYGPGRYDPAYEEHGQDYPIGYVRWTENRNMQAFVHLLADGKIQVQPLITHRFPVEEATKAHDLITGKSHEPFLAVLITFPDAPDAAQRVDLISAPGNSRDRAAGPSAGKSGQEVSVGVLGAGNYLTNVFLPVMKQVGGVRLAGVAAATGVSARYCGKRFGFQYCTTEEDEIFRDASVTTAVIATRHHLHSAQVLKALRAGKHVFVEKPLALTETDLAEIEQTAGEHPGRIVMVGFNRRFAPLAQEMKEFFSPVHEPLLIHYRVNAGFLPPEHWAHDPKVGGGRIIGEGCHFIDFASWLLNAAPGSVDGRALPDAGRYSQDNVVMTIGYPGGSIAVITYLASGDRGLSKEYVEVHGGGRSAVLEDYRRLVLVKDGRQRIVRSWWRQDKGHRKEWEAFLEAMRSNGPSPVPLSESLASMRATLAVLECLSGSAAPGTDPAGES